MPTTVELKNELSVDSDPIQGVVYAATRGANEVKIEINIGQSNEANVTPEPGMKPPKIQSAEPDIRDDVWLGVLKMIDNTPDVHLLEIVKAFVKIHAQKNTPVKKMAKLTGYSGQTISNLKRRLLGTGGKV